MKARARRHCLKLARKLHRNLTPAVRDALQLLTMNAQDILESNRTVSALARDAEREAVRRAIPPVDLRTVPRDQWEPLLGRDLALPDAVARFLAGELTDVPITVPLPREQIHAMEEAVEKFHGITAPYHAAMSLAVQRTGRAWRHEPELARTATGFLLGRDDA